MSTNVHLHVCFNSPSNDGVAAVARRHLEQWPDGVDDSRDAGYARWFLRNLSERTGENPGPKGGLILWGIVANHANAMQFAEILRPFWIDLLQGDVEGGPCDFEHILIFYEVEGTSAASAIEIGWDDEDSPNRQLLITHHEKLPFSWRQF